MASSKDDPPNQFLDSETKKRTSTALAQSRCEINQTFQRTYTISYLAASWQLLKEGKEVNQSNVCRQVYRAKARVILMNVAIALSCCRTFLDYGVLPALFGNAVLFTLSKTICTGDRRVNWVLFVLVFFTGTYLGAVYAGQVDRLCEFEGDARAMWFNVWFANAIEAMQSIISASQHQPRTAVMAIVASLADNACFAYPVSAAVNAAVFVRRLPGSFWCLQNWSRPVDAPVNHRRSWHVLDLYQIYSLPVALLIVSVLLSVARAPTLGPAGTDRLNWAVFYFYMSLLGQYLLMTVVKWHLAVVENWHDTTGAVWKTTSWGCWPSAYFGKDVPIDCRPLRGAQSERQDLKKENIAASPPTNTGADKESGNDIIVYSSPLVNTEEEEPPSGIEWLKGEIHRWYPHNALCSQRWLTWIAFGLLLVVLTFCTFALVESGLVLFGGEFPFWANYFLLPFQGNMPEKFTTFLIAATSNNRFATIVMGTYFSAKQVHDVVMAPVLVVGWFVMKENLVVYIPLPIMWMTFSVTCVEAITLFRPVNTLFGAMLSLIVGTGSYFGILGLGQATERWHAQYLFP